jgi:hypothetical protein
VQHRGQFEPLALEQDLARHYAAKVEQVVDDMAQVLALAADDLARPLCRLDADAFQADQGGGAADGRQRIAQFMSQHR